MSHIQEPVIRLINDVAAQFSYLTPDEAAHAVADHLRSFWDPRMLRQLRELAASDSGELSETAARAASLLA